MLSLSKEAILIVLVSAALTVGSRAQTGVGPTTSVLAQKSIIVSDGTVIFLSDHKLAVVTCNFGCELSVLELADGKLDEVAESRRLESPVSIYRASNEGVIVQPKSSDHAVLFERDLEMRSPLSSGYIFDWTVSTTGQMFGENSKPRGWTAYKTALPPIRVREGDGTLLSISDDAVVYQLESSIRVEDMQGRMLGSFQVGPERGCPSRVKILGKNRLWYSLCGGKREDIRDFDGRILRQLAASDGWGYRLGQSVDGSRLLFDKYTRHIGFFKSAGEVAVALSTLGLGVADQAADGEMVRVIDTRNGTVCFEWRGTSDRLPEGGYHADIDPSGRYVAIATKTAITVYDMPTSCGTK
jgi:hypothetical protein